MKILIGYYSQTGNTEAVAKALHEGLATEDVTLKKITEIDPSTLKSYDLIFIGSGIYAARFHNSVKKLLKEASELPPKFVLFYTHTTQDPKMFQTFPRDVRKMIEAAGSSICAEFECLGDQKNVTAAQIQQRLESLPLEERKKAESQMKILKGRPNREDLINAKKLAQSVL